MISIIIPVYNQAKKLDKCLESIKDQNYDNYEVIVINDGSTDNPSNRKVDVTIVKSDGSQFTPEEKGAVVKPYSGD